MLSGPGAGCSGLQPAGLGLPICWTPTPSFLRGGGGADRPSEINQPLPPASLWEGGTQMT